MVVRHKLAVSEQGQVDVTGVETSGQAGHFGPSRVWEGLLEKSYSGFHCDTRLRHKITASQGFVGYKNHSRAFSTKTNKTTKTNKQNHSDCLFTMLPLNRKDRDQGYSEHVYVTSLH